MSEVFAFVTQRQFSSLSGQVVDRIPGPEAVIRAVYSEFRDRILSGEVLDVEVSGLGVLTWMGREYRFDLLPGFAESAGLEPGTVLAGRWGNDDEQD